MNRHNPVARGDYRRFLEEPTEGCSLSAVFVRISCAKQRFRSEASTGNASIDAMAIGILRTRIINQSLNGSVPSEC